MQKTISIKKFKSIIAFLIIFIGFTSAVSDEREKTEISQEVPIDTLLKEEETKILSDTSQSQELSKDAFITETATPYFVVLRISDNNDAEALSWILKTAKNRINQDSSKIKMTFFVNALNLETTSKILKRAYRKGHEIANRTYSGFVDTTSEKIDARLLDETVWYEEIYKNDSLVSKKLRIPKETIVGFLAPRFEYNEYTFQNLTKLGFLYDASIQEQGFINPYDLENGSLTDSIWAVEKKNIGFKSASKAKGLWELPVCQWIVPHDSLAQKYGFETGLRERCHLKDSTFDTLSGKLTGVDFKIFGSAEQGGLEMNDSEASATVKYSFDCSYSENAAFSFSITSTLYGKKQDKFTNFIGNIYERRKMIEEIIDYMLSFENVRFASAKNVIEYMKNQTYYDNELSLANIENEIAQTQEEADEDMETLTEETAKDETEAKDEN